MSTNPQIIIYAAPPNEPDFTDGEDLLSLFFRLRDTGNGYRLHQSDGTKIKTEPHHLGDTSSFTFEYNELSWSITDFKIWEDPNGIFAKGNWSATPIPVDDDGDIDDAETGTFQAQAGGHPVEVGTSASA